MPRLVSEVSSHTRLWMPVECERMFTLDRQHLLHEFPIIDHKYGVDPGIHAHNSNAMQCNGLSSGARQKRKEFYKPRPAPLAVPIRDGISS